MLITLLGVGLVIYGLGFSIQALLYAAGHQPLDAYDVYATIAGSTLLLCGLTLSLSLPQALRFRFPRTPFREVGKPVYGFGSLLAIGVGATLGSPLFVLIPENIMQYEFVSLGALVIATVLSVFMAKVYGDMYVNARKRGLEAVGGPSFTKLAYGSKSVRYFVSRVSMWIANVTLAAYSKIVLVLFTVDYLPPLFEALGVSGLLSFVFTYFLVGVFIFYTVVSALFEKRLLKFTGGMQIVLGAALVVILLYESLALGGSTGWRLQGLITPLHGVSWVWALIIDTGYLYLLFYGFQEIQSLEKYTYEKSGIPGLSALSSKYVMDKPSTMKATMILSVIIAAFINILYAVAVFSAHPSLGSIESSAIPALYLAEAYLGRTHELLMALAFLLATFTTFVPAFLAASRHLASLCEDGYVPKSFSNYSWVFTLGAILLLALGNQNFLVNVINITALISLGVICLSATALTQGARGELLTLSRQAWRKPKNTGGLLPKLVGYTCFVAAAAIYYVDPSVAVFGALAILLAYLAYDVYRLGYTGTQLFLVFLALTSITLVGSQAHTTIPQQSLNLLILTLSLKIEPQTIILLLLAACGGLLLNIAVERPTPAGRRSRKNTPTRSGNESIGG